MKKTLIFSLMGLLAFSLSGCGTKPAQETASASSSSLDKSKDAAEDATRRMDKALNPSAETPRKKTEPEKTEEPAEPAEPAKPAASNALMDAIKTGNLDAVQAVLVQDRSGLNMKVNGRTPLMEAVMRDDEVIANYLLQEGANPNAVDDQGRTAFMLAVDRDDAPIARDFQNIRTFDVTKGDKSGLPPLLYVIMHKKSVKMLQTILNFPDAILSTDDDGNDALYYAAKYMPNNSALQEMLKNAQAAAD